MTKRYKLVKTDIRTWGNFKLYRIQALAPFETKLGKVEKGDLGGYIESEKNLSQDGTAWVSGSAWVTGNALVYENAHVSANAWVADRAKVYGNAQVHGNELITGNSQIF